MAIDKKKSIYFAGGKTIGMEINDSNKGIKFEKINDAPTADDKQPYHWKVTVELSISKTEAENVIKTFDEFKTEEKDFEDKFANQIYFVAQDEKKEPIFIDIIESRLAVLFDKGEKGSITINLQPLATGKTQNPKTENPVLPQPGGQ
jgi:hypothetical protein